MSTMPAAVATSLGTIHCDDVPMLEPEDGKVLVKSTYASICGSDLHIAYMGWNVGEWPLPPGHPGHEGIGVVVDGGRAGFAPGDRVLTVPSIWESRTFAGYQLLSPQYAVKLPLGLPDPQILMAQQLGTVIFGSRKLPSLEGKTVVILGQGSVGLFHDFWLRRELKAERIIVVEPVAERRAAAQIIGVDEIVDVTGDRATEAIMDLTNGTGADVVIEAVGSTGTLNQSLQMVREWGRIAVFGLPDSNEKVPFDWHTFFKKKLDVHSVFGAQDEVGHSAFNEAVKCIVEGEIDMAPFTTHEFSLENIQNAFDLASSRGDGALKVSIKIE